jgi:plastocyanin
MSTVSTVGSQFLAGEIVGETPHMHHLGTALKVNLQSATTGAKTCAIDVPHWNFEWQMDYFYAPGKGVPFTQNDTLTVECDYNNSAGNQPFINGAQLTPTTVLWGEGSYSEMCLSYTWLRYDRDAYLAAVGKM